MGRYWAIGLCFVCAPGLACGAKTLEEPGDSSTRAPDVDQGAPADSEAPRPAPGSGDKPNPVGDLLGQGDPLGACVAGFIEASEPDRPCNCFVDGACFDTKYDACACICPRTGSANTCVSRQDCEPDSRTKVSCYAL